MCIENHNFLYISKTMYIDFSKIYTFATAKLKSGNNFSVSKIKK